MASEAVGLDACVFVAAIAELLAVRESTPTRRLALRLPAAEQRALPVAHDLVAQAGPQATAKTG
jgi:hypothetical protein